MSPTDNLIKPVRLSALSMAKITKALIDGPCSIPELQDVSGLNINTLREYMRALHKEGAVHISGWEADATGRDSFRVYKLGAGKDSLRRRKSKAEVARDCRKRKHNALILQAFAGVVSPVQSM